ncbi:flavin-containing monooxygenase [Pseudoteredinibacter isoporae]|uniref:flavin-containing monooxygenase n=1 Tax=Pseudoteredinibacter isoporae TaxID=570281 RepID=UPI003103C1E6
MEELDVLIIGAGISGIGMACHLKQKCPDQRYAILEGRENFGGTWDLFRYPGIRSDSDMYTFGYSFRPWTNGADIASAESIREYLDETATEYGVHEHIRYEHRVEKLQWNSKAACWFVHYRHKGGDEQIIKARFLVTCTGYYNYEQGYLPEFPGYETFSGQKIHPQQWPEDLDYKDKRVLIIGSGATAVTLVPSMADEAAHVTMLQRSPTYVFTRPARDPIAKWLHKYMPDSWAHYLARAKNIFLSWYIFTKSKRSPHKVREFLRDMVKDEVGDSVDVDVHFNPSYKPWDQRMCLVPDSDLFKCLKEGDASIVTDHIESFTETGVTLKSGDTIEADIVVPATGLDLQFLGGIELYKDDQQLQPGELVNYKGMMFGNLPNMVAIFGYTNASWTLKADLTSDYVCRLLKHMKTTGRQRVMPKLDVNGFEQSPMIDSLKSGYIARAESIMPKQGEAYPWRNQDNYYRDYFAIRHGKLEDGVLEFA